MELFFLNKFKEFFIDSKFKSFVRYVIYKYFVLVYNLSLYFNSVF
jgi:hypothetical protein